MRGKYKDVWEKYGPAGFGLPEFAPKQGSFPLYPIRRARYALAIVASDVYDAHPDERKRVIAAALKAHPSLATEAKHVRATVKERENPRLRKNMKAPYWFVAEGAGYRLLEHGAPTKTKYKTIAAAKADVSERNNAFRAKHPKKSKKPRTRKNGPTLDRPYYPFAEKEAQYAAYTDAQLQYALADAREAAKYEDEMAKSGHGLSRYGWYADDVHTIAQEVYYRRHPEKRPRRFRTNGSSEPYDVARTLRVGDQIEVEYEPPTRTAVNAKRKVTVTAVNYPYIYVTSGKVRWGHLGGGAIRLVDMTGEVSYQPTPQQQVRDVYAIRRLKAEDEMAKAGHTRSNPTAWQKEIRKTSAPKRSKFEVTAVEYIREGTYGFDLDLGKDGYGRITLYPDGYMQSGIMNLTPALRAKMEAWIKKHTKKIKAIPEFGRAYPSNW